MIVPHRELRHETLQAVIEEYVTRDGTELSDAADKAVAVSRALDAGELCLVYDSATDSCNILPVDEAARLEREADETVEPMENAP